MNPPDMSDRVALLASVYTRIDRQVMSGLPIHNGRLSVDTIDFRAWGRHALGIVITPWFMNLTLFAVDPKAKLPTSLTLPAGEVEFGLAELPGFGHIATCSLFSPMDVFEDMTAARETAIHVLAELFTSQEKDTAVDRRSLLRGRLAESGAA